MIISKLKLDESIEIEFQMDIVGTDESQPQATLVIEGKGYDIALKGEYQNGMVKFKVPPMKGLLESGEHRCKVDVVVDGKIFTPLTESIQFDTVVSIDMRTKSVAREKDMVQIKMVEQVKEVDPDEECVKLSIAEGYEVVPIEKNGYKGKLLKKGRRFVGSIQENEQVMADVQFTTADDLIDFIKSQK